MFPPARYFLLLKGAHLARARLEAKTLPASLFFKRITGENEERSPRERSIRCLCGEIPVVR